MSNNKIIPLSPKMRQLLGGGPTSFYQNEVRLRSGPPLEGGEGAGKSAFLPVLSGAEALGAPVQVPLGGQEIPFEGAPPRPSLQSLFDPPPLMPMPTVVRQDALGQNMIPLMGQAMPPQPASGMEAAPPEPAPINWRKCPGPIEMPDGRVIQPDDYLKLNDVCEIMPYLLEALGAATGNQQKGLAPGQPVPLVGQRPGSSSFPSMPGLGVGQGPGGGGGGFPGGGGGPAGFISNTPGANGTVGPAGPPGPAGAPGAGVIADPVIKTDGDFTAAAGAFIPVPGATLTITTTQAGTVIILVQAELNSVAGGTSQNAQLGLRVNGTDNNLARRLIHTFVGGVGEFFINQPQMFALNLPPGTHTVELLLRGLTAGEYGGIGLGLATSVSANPDSPLIMTALGR